MKKLLFLIFPILFILSCSGDDNLPCITCEEQEQGTYGYCFYYLYGEYEGVCEYMSDYQCSNRGGYFEQSSKNSDYNDEWCSKIWEQILDRYLSSSSALPSSSSSIVASSSSVLPSSSSITPNSSSSSSALPSSSSVSVVYGTPIYYEGETYETVVIGTQTWFKRNLNYAVEGSKCYNDNDSNCATYGRLYNWATAMALDTTCNSSSCSSQINTPHQGICPSGWHIPSDADWDKLMTAVGGSSTAGRYLKATSGWSSNGNGNDKYGFSALPGGYGYSGGSFYYVGDLGHWWSASEGDSDGAYCRNMDYYFEGVYYNYGGKSTLYSVRCLQD